MIFCKRPPAPTFLTEIRPRNPFKGDTNEIAWGKHYENKLNDPKNSNKFVWAEYKGKKVNTLLEPELRELTKNHCAFCDIFPLQQSGGTIEHFKPKSKFPLDAYKWENLFYCCYACQKKKLEHFEDKLLKPDDDSFSFEDFFICKTDGERILLLPNPGMPRVNQHRAFTTIELYGLNDFGRPEQRYLELRKYKTSLYSDIDDFPYRYLY